MFKTWSLKSVCIAYVIVIALLFGIDSSTSFINEHFNSFFVDFLQMFAFNPTK